MEKHYILPGVSRVGGDTDAALILQLNAERLEAGVRLPKRKSSYVEVLRGTQKMSGEMVRFKLNFTPNGHISLWKKTKKVQLS